MRTETVHHVHGADMRPCTRGQSGWLEIPMAEHEKVAAFFEHPGHMRALARDLIATAEQWERANAAREHAP